MAVRTKALPHADAAVTFLLTLALSDGAGADVRADPQAALLATSLYEAYPPGENAYAEKLVDIFAAAEVPHAASGPASVRCYPGGRHDNDHADFRSIAIMPTSSEALCQKPPFLPLVCDLTTTHRSFLDVKH